MPGARKGAVWAIILLLAVFLAGAWEVMIAPLITGEVYPAYSSLRSDPLGAKALFESLAQQPGLAVSRLYKARSPLEPGTTLLILGANSLAWSASQKPVLEDYEMLLKNGGRIVLAFLPAQPPRMTPDTSVVEQNWHIAPRYRNASSGDEHAEGAIPRESALYFEAGTEWRILEERDGEALIVERDLAKGTLVLAADSYPLSNQGLAEASDGALIAQLVGPARRVLFDENQFGVSETGSVAELIRKYRLEAAMAMLAVVAGLFIWRSASSFLPPHMAVSGAVMSGRDAHEGLAALLRRNIPENQLLKVCSQQWRISAGESQLAGRLATEIQRAADPVAGYRAACRVLTEKK